MCSKSNCLISFALLLSLVLCGVASADLVGWWRLDDGTGTTAIDSSDSGNDGTLVGDPQWVSGKRAHLAIGLVERADATGANGCFPGVNDIGLTGCPLAILPGGTCPIEYQVVPDTGT